MDCNNDDIALCTVLLPAGAQLRQLLLLFYFSPINIAEQDEQTERTLEDGVQLPNLYDRGN